MKKRSLILSFLLCLGLVGSSYGDSYSIFGGLKREMTLKSGTYYYEEVSFVKAKPVILKGTVTIPARPKNADDAKPYKMNVKYDMKNAAEKISISRSVSYDVVKEFKPEIGQLITNWRIPEGGLKETMLIDDKSFELTSFQFNNTEIRDEKPAIDFTSANVFFKKTFHSAGALSESGSRIIITGESDTALSYKNEWSDLSSRIIKMKVEYDDLPIGASPEAEAERLSWQGSYDLKFSTKTSSSFENVVNDVRHISFKHGLMKNKNSEDLLVYSYDMPVLDEKKKEEEKKIEPGDARPRPKKVERKKGEGKLNSYVYENSTRLPIPKYKDIGAHWAEKSVFKLASLEAFELDEVFFPDLFINRAQFARSIVNSIGHVEYEDEAKRKAELIKSKRRGAKPLTYEDVPRDDRYFVYIMKASEEGLMMGEGNGQFLPYRPLTRAEAVSIMMRSIGVIDIAPALPFRTAFTDDASIPDWAKQAFYMADELGIVKGYKNGSCQPLKHVTRAEAAAMLDRLIEHLRTEISLDYREKLLDGR